MNAASAWPPARAQLAGEGVAAQAQARRGFGAPAAGVLQRGFQQDAVEGLPRPGMQVALAGFQPRAHPALQRPLPVIAPMASGALAGIAMRTVEGILQLRHADD